MKLAIHYSSVSTSQQPAQIFGLQVAIARWVKAYFRYATQEKFSFLIGDALALHEIQTYAGAVGLSADRIEAIDQRYARQNFSAFDVIFRPDPHPLRLLWQRQQVTPRPPALCTLAHAISGIEAGEVLERYCLDPSTATDTIICPSVAVSKAIRSFWDLYGDYLRQRFGSHFSCPVQLPVIPLGIDTEHFSDITTADKRQSQRQSLDIGDDDIVLLWVGRLSHAIKAHPLPMFQAAETAARETGKRVHLVMVGYFVPAEAEPQFQSLASDICQTAAVHFIASDDPCFPDGLWAAGDIFLSLIDNMQESFGLTPIEAMAAGLPRVISDWDGYRDCVTHGEDGFLIPTLQPPAGQGRALSELLLDQREVYGGFLAKTAQCVAVDTAKASKAVVTLINNPDLRHSMAAKAKQRAKDIYDWRHIIPAYEALWRKQAARNTAQAALPAYPSALPQAPDPFTMYAAYPSASLHPDGKLRLITDKASIEKLWRHDINTLAMDVLLPPDQIMALIRYVAAHPDAVIGSIPQPTDDAPRFWRSLGWLIKLGILSYQPV